MVAKHDDANTKTEKMLFMTLSRRLEGRCDICDNDVAAHQGPVVSRRYDFPLREVTAAFIPVGAGSSYLRAGQRARAAAGRQALPGDSGGAVVAEWMEVLDPAVLDAYRERGLARGYPRRCHHPGRRPAPTSGAPFHRSS